MQNQRALARIRSSVMTLAEAIGAPANSLPTFGSSEDFARPHIEAIGECVYYVVVERGQELVRESYLDDRPLLEQVFNGVTFEMACDFELRNRRANEDSRRQLFARKLELLGMLDPQWRDRERARLVEILREHPFSDGLGPRDGL
jgi:hypothetical protein